MTAAVRPRPAASATTPIISVTIAREALVAALGRVTLVTMSKVSLPILSAAKITHAPEGLTFVATDIDRTVTTMVPTPNAPVALLGGDPVAVTLPAKRLLDIVSQMPPGTVSLEIFPQGLGCKAKVSGGRSKFEIIGLSPDEFPVGEPLTADTSATMAAPAFLAALARALPQTSQEPSRPTQHGVVIEGTETGLYLAATDSYHLSQERLLDTTELRGEWIVPRTAVPALLKLFGACETVDIAVSATRMAFSGAGSTLDVRLIGGPYPKYGHLLTVSPVYEGVVDRSMLITAVKRMRALSELKRVKLTWHETEVFVTAEQSDGGRGEDSIPAALSATGKSLIPSSGIETAYDPTYLFDVLAAHVATEIVVQITGGRSLITYIRDAEKRDGPIVTMIAGLNVPQGL